MELSLDVSKSEFKDFIVYTDQPATSIEKSPCFSILCNAARWTPGLTCLISKSIPAPKTNPSLTTTSISRLEWAANDEERRNESIRPCNQNRYQFLQAILWIIRASVSTVVLFVGLQTNQVLLFSVCVRLLSPSPIHYLRPPRHSFQCCCWVDIASADGGCASTSGVHSGASPGRVHAGASARGTGRVIGCCTSSNAIWWVICVC